MEGAHRADGNHPSIVLWCPANEFWTDEFRGNEYIRLCDLRYVKLLYEFTKILDPTRPCVDSSGGYHIAETDLYDFHTYQGAEDTRIYLSKSSGKKSWIFLSSCLPERSVGLLSSAVNR